MHRANDIRWKQRFRNFEKPLKHLRNTLEIENPDIAQRAGLIQFFELSFELSWKLIKDFLEEQGLIEIRFPRETIKKAFETGIISDGHLWMQLLEIEILHHIPMTRKPQLKLKALSEINIIRS
jgi:nucleotidyltransferase substrate binding protein (TIGR01987 family)